MDVLTQLNAKSVDVGVLDSIMAGYYMSQDTAFSSTLMMVDGLTLATEQYGIAARKNSAFMHEVNKALVELSKDGTVKTIAEKYGIASEVCIDENYTGTAGSDTADLDYIKGNGKVIIGYTLFAPIAYEEGGELIGFDIDLARAVCQKLGLEAEFVVINWKTKEASLEAKSIDLIWNGMTITEKRLAEMEISIPYLNNKQVAVIRTADKDKYKTTADMKDAIMCAEDGSAGADCIVPPAEE